ncbi:hypothetical protein M422DRAFT_267123 [Sphaerobolus stellatus SS14]|uniref:Uncharacterized protein n=1 Tax=Sphaerobolus stellatus (strain SS14) TaxID=990650 RepID=A0A0C9V156_SPHS4|nr:hypothetical protein M422DRAFT_267123 [Sphaerobolus stellatus SS14]
MSTTETRPTTPECGCAVNADGSLKETHEIEFLFSPSAEERSLLQALAGDAADTATSPAPTNYDTLTVTDEEETAGQWMRTRSAAKAAESIRSGGPMPP